MGVEEPGDSIANLVANPANVIERLAFRIFEWPIVTSKARNIGTTLVAAPHRY